LHAGLLGGEERASAERVLRGDGIAPVGLQASREAANRVRQLRAAKQYQQALGEISRLRPAIDKFFDEIMVMVEDESLRGMRLALLERLVSEFSTIADFSEIVTEGKS